jgi:hypothetical protein
MMMLHVVKAKENTSIDDGLVRAAAIIINKLFFIIIYF